MVLLEGARVREVVGVVRSRGSVAYIYTICEQTKDEHVHITHIYMHNESNPDIMI